MGIRAASMFERPQNDPVLKRFRAAVGEIYGDRVERVVLFGSRAHGDAQPESDYDVAVFLRDIADTDRAAGPRAKRHSTAQGEFARLVKDDPRFDTELRAFLPRAYNLKAIADYQTGPGSQVTVEQARGALQTGRICTI
jgi:predicted nucleotidyltransferase